MNSEVGKQSARFQFIDAAKTLAIYLVIFYHIGTAQKNIETITPAFGSYFRYFVHGLSTIAVPLFLAINGYLVLNRNLVLKKHLVKTLRLYVLTLVWSLIIVSSLIAIDGSRYSVAEFARAVFFLKQGENNHLWFLFVLTSIYLLLPAIKSIYDYPNKNVILWTLLLIFVFSFGNLAANWLFNLWQVAHGHAIDIVEGKIKRYQPFDVQGVNPFSGYAWAWVYFLVGGLLGRQPQNGYKAIPTWGLCIGFFAAAFALFGYGLAMSEYLNGKIFDTTFDGYNSLPGLVMTMSTFLILHRIWTAKGPIAVLVASIGANTLGIYLLHVIVLRFLNHEFHALAICESMPVIAVYAAAILFSSWLLTLLLRRVPVVGYLFRL